MRNVMNVEAIHSENLSTAAATDVPGSEISYLVGEDEERDASA